MGKYVLKRLLHAMFSIVMVVLIVMILVYGLMDRMKIFKTDGQYQKQANNQRITYMNQKWEEYGYLDYVPYADYLIALRDSGEIDEETRAAAVNIGQAQDGSEDPAEVAEYVQKYCDYYESQGYEITRLGAVVSRGRLATGGMQALFAVKDRSVLQRLWDYFTGIFEIDTIHKVPENADIGERGLTFTWYDPVKNPPDAEKKVFSPAIIGNGTTHKYLLYFDGSFPFIHQNFLTIHLGTSYSVSRGVEVFTSMTQAQGAYSQKMVTIPPASPR